eukprot:1376019-Amorphochlora_amoeboformis.AAC.2
MSRKPVTRVQIFRRPDHMAKTNPKGSSSGINPDGEDYGGRFKVYIPTFMARCRFPIDFWAGMNQELIVLVSSDRVWGVIVYIYEYSSRSIPDMYPTGSLMNVGNKLGANPSIRLYKDKLSGGSGNAMKNALTDEAMGLKFVKTDQNLPSMTSPYSIP